MKKKVFPIIFTFLLTALLCLFPIFKTTAPSASAMSLGLQVYVNSQTTPYDIDCEPTDRIEDVKAKVVDLTGCSIENVHLFFANKHLEEGNTLQDYSIQKNSTIYCYITTPDTACNEADCAGMYHNGVCILCNHPQPTTPANLTSTIIWVGAICAVVLLGGLACIAAMGKKQR